MGTYFPKENRDGRMGLKVLLAAVAEKWKNEREELLHTASEMTAYLRREDALTQVGGAEGLPKKAAEQLLGSYDREYGGFGWQTKFPTPHNLIFLMEYAALTGDKKPREAVEHPASDVPRRHL